MGHPACPKCGAAISGGITRGRVVVDALGIRQEIRFAGRVRFRVIVSITQGSVLVSLQALTGHGWLIGGAYR
ncbi:hypothetical protein ANO11243_065560 [Dothideomycetidae sp. 11243]|nr:hypothetical protein ANO11243_065560 [fungal sp. No.11243]